jgi:hypothetical protein
MCLKAEPGQTIRLISASDPKETFRQTVRMLNSLLYPQEVK